MFYHRFFILFRENPTFITHNCDGILVYLTHKHDLSIMIDAPLDRFIQPFFSEAPPSQDPSANPVLAHPQSVSDWLNCGLLPKLLFLRAQGYQKDRCIVSGHKTTPLIMKHVQMGL